MKRQRTHAPGRRALSNVGGRARLAGDPAVAKALASAARPPGKADPRALTHGFHAWPARMHPFTAGALIDEGPPGVVADPFMGGGTVVVEALVAGRAVVAADVNPVALEVAWARTRRWSGERRAALVARAHLAVEAARRFRHGKRVDDAIWKTESEWFDPPALAEAWSLAEVLGHTEGPDADLDRMLRVCLSSVLVKASKQVSDSVPVKDAEHAWTPARRVEDWFVAKAEEHAGALAALYRAIRAEGPPRLLLADARRPPDDVGPVAHVVTSPPYPGVYDYAAHHERRYALLGLDAGLARSAEVGARRSVRVVGRADAERHYVNDIAAFLAAWGRHLEPRGRVTLVVGDGQAPDGPIPTLPLIAAAAREAGFGVLASVSQPRPAFGPGRGKRPPGGRDGKEEHVIALTPAAAT